MQAENLIAVGVNHKVCPVAIREKLAFSGGCQEPLQIIKSIEGCTECCLLSTCNRVEVIFVAKDPDEAAANVRRFLFARSGLSEEDTKTHSYYYKGEDAITHIFRVASSLDSMIVGEPQILGQLKGAFRDATENKTAGVILNRFMHKSFSVAKRIRTETNIGSSAVSISFAAVQLAKKIFGELKNKRVMLIGAGEMAELAAEHLISQGISEVVVANRTLERAMKLARRFNGRAVGLDELSSELATVDILISSTGATDLVLRREDVKPIMRQRMNSPLFLIDIAVPRDLDPRLNDLDNIYLYDIDDLQHVVDINKTGRDKEAGKGERIVVEETMKFLQWIESMEVAPTIVAMRQKAEGICRDEVAKTLRNFKDLTAKQQKSLEKMAAAITNKLLHHPIKFVKQEQTTEERQENLAVVRRVFALDPEQDAHCGDDD